MTIPKFNELSLARKAAILTIFVILLAGAVLLFEKKQTLPGQPESETKALGQTVGNQPEAIEPEVVETATRRLDGLTVPKGEEDIFPVAVMIDNHPDARPQAGLSSAQVVYEAEVEGGITRFMAIFASGQPLAEIGPVRSSRPYFIDWAEEYGALYVHCGGSPEALAKLAKEKIFHLDQFYNGPYFWRSADRSAPHNLLTSSAKLKEFITSKNKTVADYQAWNFKNEKPEADRGEDDGQIEILFNSKNFTVIWKYDIISNSYNREMGGLIHKDQNGQEIKAKNIIIQIMKKSVLDEKNRLKIYNTGQGTAIFCLDGFCRAGEWQKKEGEKTQYFSDQADQKLELNPGTTWIETVAAANQVKY